MELLKLKPVFKEMIWGGGKLGTIYGKPIPSDRTGESWEAAEHKNGCSLVDGGKYDGMKITEALSDMDGMGSLNAGAEKFPLLIKFIDANDKLSVQVHPDDAYAAELEQGELGKTEMWYILDAAPGAKLIYGFDRDVTREEYAEAIKEGRLNELLNVVDARKGDVFFIPAGRVHAICDGLLIAEIQQNSDTTYRLFDWNRVDKNGNPRQLHIEKGVKVSDVASSKGREYTTPLEYAAGDAEISVLAMCRYFAAERVSVSGKAKFECGSGSFSIFTVLEGEGGIAGSAAKAGDSFIMPAGFGGYAVTGEITYIRSYVPDLAEERARLEAAGFTSEQIDGVIK
ncbi:MAG: class I mannose-6-phosphate isomerase [Clostridia bacterium]|nr:class I mannose-6-phosphate isomerase [Clostridia bacterium]